MTTSDGMLDGVVEPGEIIGGAMRLVPKSNDVYGPCYDPVNILGRRVAAMCEILAKMGATDDELKKAFAKYGDLTLEDISVIEFAHRTDNPERGE